MLKTLQLVFCDHGLTSVLLLEKKSDRGCGNHEVTWEIGGSSFSAVSCTAENELPPISDTSFPHDPDGVLPWIRNFW
jgi:hypothetical protein